jgi:hypothetical protein
MWTDSSDTQQGPVVGSCEHGNEPLSFIKGGEFIDQLSDYELFKKDSSSLLHGVSYFHVISYMLL